MTARATAMAWRWPPEREPTSWRTDLTVETARSLSSSLVASSILISSRIAARVSSRPRYMFWTMSRLSQSERSWYTVAMPRSLASLGEWAWISCPFHSTWPDDGG